MSSVGIIGAGITGLTAGFYLQRAGVPVTIYEASGRAGGVIQSLRKDGYLAEFGPNTILESAPEIRELVADSGLAARRLNSDPRATPRYLVRDRQPVAMPGSPLGFVTTKLFSAKAKLGVLGEPFRPRRTDGVEETVADFVVRRLGQEFLDYAIDALVAGIYAGDPRKLSLREAFPKLADTEARYGSLIKGQVFGARDRKRRGTVAKDRAPKFSFDEGLQVLPDALAANLRAQLRLNTQVESIARTETGWAIRTASGTEEHSAVIYCGTAGGLARLTLNAPDKVDLSAFATIRYPPIAGVVLGFRREDVSHPCKGFGMLIPGIEKFNLLGTIFSSSLFPNRAPAGHLTLTSYVGGERNPELAALPPERLIELTTSDLKVLLGVSGRPTFTHCSYYPKAIPQYNLAYGRYRKLLGEIEDRAPGMFFAGHYRDGVALSDSIVSGRKMADRIAAWLRAGNHPQKVN